MATKSKFFRVAVEGATATDGRTIERQWIDEIVATYNQETYGARVNLEHIRGYTGEGPFIAYGDVLAVEKREVELTIGGKRQKRLALYAQIEPTAELVALTKKKQKIYTSIEVHPNFANTGKAGLVGLAATDNPASLGTEVLKFAAENPDLKLFDNRKSDPATVLSETIETNIEFEDDAASAGEAFSAESFLAGLTKIFNKLGAPAQPAAPAAAPAAPAPQGGGDAASGFSAEQQTALTGLFKEVGSSIEKALAPLNEKVTALNTDLAAFKAKVEGTENLSAPPRPVASGGQEYEQIDC